ncbi:PREDICTED: uncharacterized protein LOC109373824 isoform X2 [Hipposideros armiger]|uniref:Uncharacterized protein LOC109373824 isoform X2 n=1 Tax=Hipposideros armiger TaxID=186990 RepID=A0A8B7Q470_HIPAR|nr:PREDICTED: uncharacterized protein LOC109373824 isoform X2 [Hipposideros armiger]
MDARTAPAGREHISCPKGATKTVVTLKNYTYMMTVLKQQENIVPPRKNIPERAQESYLFWFFQEKQKSKWKRACDTMCGFRRYNRSRTRAGGGPPAQDITSDTLQLAPSAPQHCHSRGGQQASQFSLCLTLWYFSHRKVYVFMWLKLQIFPLYGSRASFLTKSLFPQDPQSPASGDNCRASAWFPGHAPAGRTRTSRPSCSSQARTLCGQDAVGCHPEGQARCGVSLLLGLAPAARAGVGPSPPLCTGHAQDHPCWAEQQAQVGKGGLAGVIKSRSLGAMEAAPVPTDNGQTSKHGPSMQWNVTQPYETGHSDTCSNVQRPGGHYTVMSQTQGDKHCESPYVRSPE